jgi:hypothetical protein
MELAMEIWMMGGFVGGGGVIVSPGSEPLVGVQAKKPGKTLQIPSVLMMTIATSTAAAAAIQM